MESVTTISVQKLALHTICYAAPFYLVLINTMRSHGTQKQKYIYICKIKEGKTQKHTLYNSTQQGERPNRQSCEKIQ